MRRRKTTIPVRRMGSYRGSLHPKDVAKTMRQRYESGQINFDDPTITLEKWHGTEAQLLLIGFAIEACSLRDPDKSRTCEKWYNTRTFLDPEGLFTFVGHRVRNRKDEYIQVGGLFGEIGILASCGLLQPIGLEYRNPKRKKVA